MEAFRNVAFWFVALLAVLIAGFWKSYFSIIFDGPHPTHHFHGTVMILWVLLLISQAWLVRTRKLDVHRMMGQTSFVLAPLVVISGIVVTFHNIATADDPTQPFMLSLYWFGWFHVLAFAVFYALAMVHRKDFNTHARYMIATGLMFLYPGLSRTIFRISEFLGVAPPSFYNLQFLMVAIGVALIAWDRMQGRFRAPFILFTALWLLNLVLWQALPGWEWWQAFSAWSVIVWQ